MGIKYNSNVLDESRNLEKQGLISFLLAHFYEDQETALLSAFENREPIFLSDIYKDFEGDLLEETVALNIYESAYLRLLLDFGYIRARNFNEPVSQSLLYALLNKGLFCVAVDLVMSLTNEETNVFSQDLNLLAFLNKKEEDGNIIYLKKTIFK